MAHASHPPPSPVAAVVAVFGGVIAQAAPDTNVGAAGLILAITALLGGGFQYFKYIVDARQQSKMIEHQAATIVELQRQVSDGREKRHEDRNRFNALLVGLNADLVGERLRVAKLEGQLGITDRTHADAINSNSANIRAVADGANIPLPAATPHVEPVVRPPSPDSGDDLSPFLVP